jgi:hypothetical protein
VDISEDVRSGTQKESSPKTHDFTQPRWGHDYTFTPLPNNRGTMIGWGEDIKEGDYLILKHAHGTTRYRVSHIDYYTDPGDMWRMEVCFAPR